MQKWNQIFGLLILTFFTSCQYDPYAHKLTTNEPRNYDLVGEYLFDTQTVEDSMNNFRNKNGEIVRPRIIIKMNGEFDVKNIPYFKGFPPKYNGLISKKGTWTKDILGAIDIGEKENLKHWGIHLTEMPIELKGAGLMNKKHPYDLIFTFGDPDQGDVMIFKKQ